MQFFLLFYFCNFLHAVTSALRNCLFVLLPGFLRFSIMCIFSSLPYFFFWFSLVLTWFFCEIAHFYTRLLFADSSGAACSLSATLCRCGWILFGMPGYSNYRFVIRFWFALMLFFFHFFCSFRVCLFFFWGHWFAPSKVAGLRFFCAAVAILLF